MFDFNIKATSRAKWSSDQKREIIDQHPACTYCGEDDYSILIVEHIYPIRRGGSNNKNNLTIACVRCNSHKYCYTIEEFYENIIKKLEVLRDNTFTHIFYLRRLRDGRPFHYMHSEHSVAKKIAKFREEHSYYTRIKSSILFKKYQIF